MMLLEQLEGYQKKRRFPDWEPLKPDSKYKGGDRELLERCLDFLPLELQVAEWDSLVDIPEIRHILDRNASDETKHDEVIRHLWAHFDKTSIAPEAQELIDRWQSSTEHPVTLMYALEMGVFFSILPVFIIYGNVYTGTVSQWISDDERVHAETGLCLIKYLGLKLTRDVLQLVYDTNYYLFGDDLKAQRAVRRVLTAKDPEMARESLPITVSFFEQSNKNNIVYLAS